MFDKLDDLLIRFEEVLNELGEPGVTDNQEHFQKLMKEQSDLQPIVDAYREYKKNKETIQDSLSMLENMNLRSFFFRKILMITKTLLWRSVQVQVGMKLPFLQQRFTVCM